MKNLVISAAIALTVAASTSHAQTQQERDKFLQNTAILMASEHLCGFQIKPETLANTFHAFGVKPEDIEPGGKYNDKIERTKKHIAAATSTEQGLKNYCGKVRSQLGMMLHE